MPLPDMDTQKRVVKNILAIREKANCLKQEAIEGLEKTKAEVEAIILGEAKA